jgi:hypothetical protein
MDPLNENVVQLLQTSQDPFVVQIWKDAEIIGMAHQALSDTQFGARTRLVVKALNDIGLFGHIHLLEIIPVFAYKP